MIICVCHRVSDRDITRAVKSGCRRFEDLQNATRVGTGCGVCLACARAHFDEQMQLSPVEPSVRWTAAGGADPARGAGQPAAAVQAP